MPLTARFGVIEFDGRDMLNVSLGFSTLRARVPRAPACMASIAARVRREADLPVATAWGMDIPQDAERAVAEQQLDLVMMARAHLANPHYPFMAGRELKIKKASTVLPDQYEYWLCRYPGAAVMLNL